MTFTHNPPYHTQLDIISPSEHRNYCALLVALWPALTWRHSNVGMLQAYIAEGSDKELRVHLWYPTLVKPGIAESGLCHDHRFVMRSSVLVGAMRQTEFKLEENPDGEWETQYVLHAREAMKQGGSFHKEHTPTGKYYSREESTWVVPTGFAYTFDKFEFHESEAYGLTITLVEKSEQEEVNARLLTHRNKPVVHAFKDTLSPTEFTAIIAEGKAALQREII